MLNINTFLKRLEEVMENHQLNAAGFAERIGVQRSSVSHILSKRNKPSLDFILKIYNTFDDVSLDWLLLDSDQKKSIPLPSFKSKEKLDTSLDHTEKPNEQVIQAGEKDTEDVVQIIQIYRDGNFSSFYPKS